MPCLIRIRRVLWTVAPVTIRTAGSGVKVLSDNEAEYAIAA